MLKKLFLTFWLEPFLQKKAGFKLHLITIRLPSCSAGKYAEGCKSYTPASVGVFILSWDFNRIPYTIAR